MYGKCVMPSIVSSDIAFPLRFELVVSRMEIMPNVKDILTLMDSPTEEDRKFIEKAYSFAQVAHEEHLRKSGEPYFIHLFETAKKLAEIGMGPKAVAAGFLHDSIEDAGVTEAEIKEKFGEEVLTLVEGVTKLGKLKYRGLSRHAESLRKLFVATSQDVRVLIIKLADRLHNMKTLEHVAKEKRKRIALETLEVYVPIADRLGMGQMKGELEDLAFPHIHPKEYEKVRELLKDRKTETLKQLEKINKTLMRHLGNEKIKVLKTDFRSKRLYSLFKKLERKDWDIDKVYDISALRIIVPTIADCYRVLGVVHAHWNPLPGRIKDYIALPKPNGYQSIHTTIFTGDGGIVEIQIRTEKMHREAEYGIASHLSYKSEGRKNLLENLEWIRNLLPERVTKNAKGAQKRLESGKTIPQWIKQIADAQKEFSESDEFLQELKADFFNHRVFVFTPQGDVIDLPIDSSPIDFAYAIHSNIGNHTAGAKVNGKLSSLETHLKNGDIVEIVTKEKAKPSPKWLDFVRTADAKRNIRSFLEKEKGN